MKIAYVTSYDAKNIHEWSGTGYYISRTLHDNGFVVDYIGNLRNKIPVLMKIKRRFYSKFLKETYLSDREPFNLNYYARQIEERLSLTTFDFIFSPGTIPISCLHTNLPIVFWTDATFAGMIDFYPSFSRLCRETIRNGNRMEQQALSKARLAIYSSDWAAKTAIDNYHVDPKKVKVVPYGANVDCRRTLEDIRMILETKSLNVCKLLFIGVDWERKGGPIALRTAEILKQLGVNVYLNIVGCKAPDNLPDFVTSHGFISKANLNGNQFIEKLFIDSHFLILPTRAECAAVVFAEASSFGLPSLATNVGGVSTIVKDDVNGKLFSLEDPAEKYSEYIVNTMSTKEKYNQLAMSAFREYQQRLNWASAGQQVRQLINEFCV